MKRLKDESNALTAQRGPLAVRELPDVDSCQPVRSLSRTVEAAQRIEERRFSRSGRPRDRQVLALTDREIDPPQSGNGRRTGEDPADILEFDDRCHETPTTTRSPSVSWPSTAVTCTRPLDDKQGMPVMNLVEPPPSSTLT